MPVSYHLAQRPSQREHWLEGTDRRMDGTIVTAVQDDLSREVYCLLGIPIDAIEMSAVLRNIDAAAASNVPFVISTPNLNFLVNSLADSEFRESLLGSDLCPADGMPIVWIARLIGIPIKSRIAGSDIFEALKSRPTSVRPLKIFLFGATPEVAAEACRRINRDSAAMKCVGWSSPGFGNVDELSSDYFIDRINSSNADFLVAALGAKKGQSWLMRNHDRLRIPIRSHLGATINFQAGTVKRAPYAWRRLGVEWLWRIKEEPSLFARYWHDGGVLIRLLLNQVLPLAVRARSLRLQATWGRDLVVSAINEEHIVTLRLTGFAIADQLAKATPYLRDALMSQKQIVVDFAATQAVDARFFGLLLMLRKQIKGRGGILRFIGISSALERQFRLNGLGYL